MEGGRFEGVDLLIVALDKSSFYFYFRESGGGPGVSHSWCVMLRMMA